MNTIRDVGNEGERRGRGVGGAPRGTNTSTTRSWALGCWPSLVYASLIGPLLLPQYAQSSPYSGRVKVCVSLVVL